MRLHLLKKYLLAQPPAQTPYPTQDLQKDFYLWQIRVMFGLMWGYALFYLVRKNFSMAMPGIEAEYGFSNTALGWFLSTHSLLYGIGKFLNGILSDYCHPRWFMSIGLILSALINYAFGFSSEYYIFGALWMLNGWIQSMGWPPCARLLTTWYEKKNRSTWWGLWNASHQIGGAVILILGGYLGHHFGWRAIFWVPATIALFGSLLTIWALRDKPSSIGFPPPDEVYQSTSKSNHYALTSEIERDKQEEHLNQSNHEQLVKYIFFNPLIWFVSLGNCFVYIIRIGMLDWAPKLLKQYQSVDLKEAGWLVATLEIAGILGGLYAGYLTDRSFKGKGALVNALFMFALTISLLFVISYQFSGVFAYALILSMIGFLVYGPQMLTSVCAAQYAPTHLAGAATGFNGLWGYIGASIAGVGTGLSVDYAGWNGAMTFYAGAALIGFILFVSAHIYEKRKLIY